MTIDLERLSPPERLLWSYGVTSAEHIDLEGIANARGAKVIYRPLVGCEARLVAGPESAIISVNPSPYAGRQRFSLAHELAHWLCDRNTGTFLCAKEDIGPQNAQARSVEAFANGYASQLVLPNYLVEPWAAGRRVNLDIAAALAEDFRVSRTAAAIKLVKRSSVPSCVTCHSKSGRLWFQRNDAMGDDFFPLSQLHQESDAFDLVFTATSKTTRPKRGRADRWLSGKDCYRREVESQSMKLPDGTVLTLISILR